MQSEKNNFLSELNAYEAFSYFKSQYDLGCIGSIAEMRESRGEPFIRPDEIDDLVQRGEDSESRRIRRIEF